MHSPLVLKVEVTKRSKVRRNYLSYMRALTGKATRLSGIDFDSQSVNKIEEPKTEETEVLETTNEVKTTGSKVEEKVESKEAPVAEAETTPKDK
jgi:hypothetical protein